MILFPVSLPSGTGSALLVPPVIPNGPSTAGVGLIYNLRGRFAQEDTGSAPAKLQILDGPGGNLLVPITLSANESTREFVPEGTDTEIRVATGQLYILRLSGTSTVTVFYAA